METSENLLSNELHVDSQTIVHLRETAGWARFLGILGFIFAVLLAIVAFIIPAIFAKQAAYPYRSYQSASISSMMGGALTAVYLVCAALMFFVALFTYKFGSKTKLAIATTDQESLNQGLKNLKFLFRFYGIVAIIYLGIIVLGIVLGGLGAAFS